MQASTLRAASHLEADGLGQAAEHVPARQLAQLAGAVAALWAAIVELHLDGGAGVWAAAPAACQRHAHEQRHGRRLLRPLPPGRPLLLLLGWLLGWLLLTLLRSGRWGSGQQVALGGGGGGGSARAGGGVAGHGLLLRRLLVGLRLLLLLRLPRAALLPWLLLGVHGGGGLLGSGGRGGGRAGAGWIAA